MRPVRRWEEFRPSSVLVAVSLSMLLSCGYGFGNREFALSRQTAVAFARAVQAGDTARMRQLSWGWVHDSAAAIARALPTAYTQFAKPTPQLLTLGGGGLYGGAVTFLVRSTRLDSCRGGLRLDVGTFDKKALIVSVRPDPPPDTVTDYACRTAIGPLSGTSAGQLRRPRGEDAESGRS